jgi:cbb3-type cytochrome oxidase maturation protein
MSVIILLIIFSIIVALVFLFAFIWAVKSGQYDDTESPSVRILFEEKKKKNKQGESKDPVEKR